MPDMPSRRHGQGQAERRYIRAEQLNRLSLGYSSYFEENEGIEAKTEASLLKSFLAGECLPLSHQANVDLSIPNKSASFL
jgi:hypothetical protein